MSELYFEEFSLFVHCNFKDGYLIFSKNWGERFIVPIIFNGKEVVVDVGKNVIHSIYGEMDYGDFYATIKEIHKMSMRDYRTVMRSVKNNYKQFLKKGLKNVFSNR